ncbi:Uncharacterised protein [Vibrio cholerae]|nr:Uncharacterised protein [Vibrio cholerae]
MLYLCWWYLDRYLDGYVAVSSINCRECGNLRSTPPSSRWGTWSISGATEYHQSSVRFGCRHHIVGGSGGCQFLTHECVRYQSIDHPKNISHEM